MSCLRLLGTIISNSDRLNKPIEEILASYSAFALAQYFKADEFDKFARKRGGLAFLEELLAESEIVNDGIEANGTVLVAWQQEEADYWEAIYTRQDWFVARTETGPMRCQNGL